MGVLYINNTKVDTSEDIAFPITYSIADIKNPNARKRNRTKTIVLPDTPNNRSFFSSAYQFTLSDTENTGVGFDFNHNLKYDAIYESNGVAIFKGVCRLFSASITNGVLSIEVSLYSDIINMFDTWGDLKINELGWSEYDHTLNKTSITDSWSTTDSTGYVYGLVYYGYGSSPTTYKTNDLVPYVFQNEILRKALAYLGYQLSSSSLLSGDFTRLMWGFGGGDKVSITGTEVNNRYVFVDADTANTGLTAFANPITQLSFNSFDLLYNFSIDSEIQLSNINTYTVNNDLLQQVNYTNGDWNGGFTIGNKGFYRLSFSGELNLLATWSYGSPDSEGFNADMNFFWTFQVKKNGYEIANYKFERLSRIANVSDTDNLSLDVDSLCNAGDVIEFGYKMESFNTHIYPTGVPLSSMVTTTITMDFQPTSVFDFKVEAINKELVDGDTVNIARYMPDTKVSDFFNDIIVTQNLYIDDPKDGIIRMETFENYYDGSYDDWTSKIDMSKEIKFSPPRLEGKDYIFKFAEDRDFYKDDYYKEFGVDYGDYKITINGSYKKGEKIWKTTFAQSIPVDVSPNTVPEELIVPVIAKSENNGATFQPYKGKPRVFYYNGLKTCYPWSFQDSSGLNPTSNSTYPQFHHLNNVDSPTFDYNFGKPDKVYYQADEYTLDNIVQRHYFTFLKSVLSKEAKIMTAYFNLNESDFYNNFLKTYARVDCVNFIKNLVQDYNDNKNDTTMVELFKVVDGVLPNTSVIAKPNLPSSIQVQDYSDGVGVNYSTEASQVISPNSVTKLLNNNSTSELEFMPNGVGEVYNDSINSFDFSNLGLGSVVDMSIFIEIDSNTQSHFDIYIVFNQGLENEYKVPFILSSNDFAGDFHLAARGKIVINDLNQNFVGDLFIENTKSCTVTVESYQYTINAIQTWKK